MIGVMFTNCLEDEHLLNNSTNIALENHHEQGNINYKSSIYTMAKLSKTGAPSGQAVVASHWGTGFSGRECLNRRCWSQRFGEKRITFI